MNTFLRLIILPITFLTWLCASPLVAQSSCVTFDNLDSGKVFLHSNTAAFETHVTTEASFRVLLRALPVLTTPASGKATAVEARSISSKLPAAKGIALELQSSVLNFRWADPSRKITAVCFDIYADSGAKSFSVNGLPAATFRTLADLNGLSQAFTGIKISASVLPGANSAAASVCIEGSIDQFAIGGENVILDNICYRILGSNQLCALEGRISGYLDLCGLQPQLKLEVNEELKRLYADTAQVQVIFDGFRGIWRLGALPIAIPFSRPVAGSLGVKVQICLPGIPDCCTDLVLQARTCDPAKDQCIQFEDLRAGARYGKESHQPGQTIFIEDKVPVSLDSFIYTTGGKAFGYTAVSNDLFEAFFPKARNNRLLVSNINLKFDFSRNAAEGRVRKVCFDFADGGGEENIRVNNGKTIVIKKLSELDKDTIAEGVIAYFTPSDRNANLENGTLCLLGFIDSLFIGGQELGLDNICFDRVREEPCKITDLIVARIQCDSTGKSYSLTFDAKVTNAGDSLTVKIEQAGYKKRIAVKDLPARLEGIPMNNSRDELYGILEVCADKKTDSALTNGVIEDCCLKTRYLLPCQDTTPPCSITDIKVSELRCDDSGKSYSLVLNATVKNAGDSLTFFLPGSNFRYRLAVTDLPVKIAGIPVAPSTAASLLQVAVLCPDRDSRECCAEFRYETPCRPQICSITEVKVDDIRCGEDGKTYSLTLYWKAQNAGDSLKISTNSGYGITVAAAAGKIRLEKIPVPANSLIGVIEICSFNKTSAPCCGVVRYELPCRPQPCSITDLKVADVVCDSLTLGPRQTYGLTLYFKAVNAGDSLWVTTTSGYRTKIPAGNSPVRLRGIPAIGNQGFDILEVCAASPLTVVCCNKIRYEVPCGAKCEIRDLKVADIKCDPEKKTFSFTLNLIAQNPGEALILETDSGFRTKIDPAKLPARIENVPYGNEPGFTTIIVCGSNADDCCAKLRFALPCAPMSACEIGALKTETTRCDDQGKFSVFLKFEYKNTSDSFMILINGKPEGTFAYKQLPVKLGPFQGPLTQPMNITVYDSKNRACNASIVLQPFRCETPVCKLENLRVFDIKCNNNGAYSAWIKLNAPNAGEYLSGKTSTGFQFRFRTADMPVRIEGIPVPREGTDVIQICDPGKPDCCIEMRFKVPCQEPCYIGPIKAEQICKPNGLFVVKLNFGHQNTGKQFSVLVNGVNYGVFSYDKLPVEVGPFFQKNQPVLEIKVEDAARGCSSATRLPVEPCASACNFNNLKAEVLACENGKFYAGLSFQAPQSDSGRAYIVFVNGRIFGPYPYSQNPIRLGPFAANGVTQYNFLVIDLANPTCHAYTSIRPVVCAGEACKISNLIVKPIDCKPDGSQRVLVDFDYDHAPGNTFALFMNNGFIGNYPLDKLPLELVVRRPAAIAAGLPVEFSACIRGAENCCTNARAELLDCPLPCREPAVSIDRKECTPNGVFSVELKAGPQAGNTFFYAVFLNGQLRDTLRPVKPVVTLNALKGDSVTVYTIEVVSYDGNQRCIKTFKVGPVNCTPGPVAGNVWPGDANQDNVANYIDLLNIGVAFGAKGPERADRSAEWKSTPASDWKERFPTGQNFKHADANGDGVVDEDDIKVVAKNYGKTHGVVQPAEELPGTSLDPAILLDLPNGPIPASGSFEIPIKLGTKDRPVRNIYGMAFTLKVDPAIIDLKKIEVIVPTSWMGRPGVNLAHIHRIHAEEGLIEIAITRIDQNEVSGYGEIAFLKGGIKDDIAGRQETSSEMLIRHGAAVRLNQETVPISGSTMDLHVAPAAPAGQMLTENPTVEEVRAGLKVFPNPASGDQLNIRHLSGLPVEEVQIIGLDGRPASQLFRETNYIDLSNVPGGVYMIRIKVNGYIYYEKLVRQK